VKTVPLFQVSKINPRFINSGKVSNDSKASFVPMAFVSEKTKSIVNEEERSLGEVIKGFTYFENDDVLLAKITPCFENGKIALAKINNKIGFGSTEFHVVRADKDKLDSKYLFHFLRRNNILFEGEKRMTGSAGQKRVPKAFLENLEIPLPPLPEQKRIAEVLDKADALREKRRLALQKLDTLLQSIFLEMFGDPVKNPKGWERKEIGKLNLFIADGNYSSKYPKASEFVSSGVPFIRANNLRDGTVIGTDLRFISETKHKELKKGHLKEKDLLITTRGEIGTVALVPANFEDANINAQIVLFRCLDEQVNPAYLLCAFQNKKTKKMLEGYQTGTALKQLPVGRLEKFPILVPQSDLQKKFASIFFALQKQKKSLRNSEILFENLFQSLQQRAFKGELFSNEILSVEPQEEKVWQQTSLF
jgi:type I restriction enzyme S subunit